MNWGQFEDPLCYPCLHGTVVSSLSLNLSKRLWVQDSDFLQKYFTNSVDSTEIIQGKLRCSEHEPHQCT